MRRKSCAPESSAPAGAPLTVLGDHVLTLTRGETITLKLQETDAQGRPVQAAGAYSWDSSDPAIVRVSPDGGLTTGTGLGYALVSVRSTRGLTATRHVWVQPPASEPSTFRITLVFEDDVPQRWREYSRPGRHAGSR